MIKFLSFVVGVSLSGVMAPGPMTAATLAAGARGRHAGAVIALGHGVVEFPLMILIIAGLGRWFQIEGVKIGIGLIGGIFLAFLGIQMFREVGKTLDVAAPRRRRGNLLTGIIMTGGNPYFLMWWATAGLALATQAVQFGILAFAIFAVVHWLCDLIWLEVLSAASFRGSQLLSERRQRWVLIICGGALVIFAGMFLWDAGFKLIAAWRVGG